MLRWAHTQVRPYVTKTDRSTLTGRCAALAASALRWEYRVLRDPYRVLRDPQRICRDAMRSAAP